ncbi:MAG: tRNA preQ1(34) S-adenosylmethionine ribosyltransferase-isomerase QueA [Verrucomicrobiota bacterium JB022]|nr:tRNA preQ1(34) S-adenosylmethionine ribosyltransferase-isomerase QueA [Verrucomicrobiota bacterium JB022]
MDTSLFDYELPPEAIAQSPAQQRDASRLLVVDRARRTHEHRFFYELAELLPGKTRFFRNNVSVLPARLQARRPSGGAVECLLLRPAAEAGEWWCLVKPGRRLPIGATFGLPGAFEAEVRAKDDEGRARVRFDLQGAESVVDLAHAIGELPLPHYIERPQGNRPEDLQRYQTVFADPTHPNAVAAPTAGLHFTPTLLDQLAAQGHAFHDLRLEVGLGTFRPVKTERIEDHPMHSEAYHLSAETRAALHAQDGARKLAVGTTTLRAIEDYFRQPASRSGETGPYTGEANIFIYPPAPAFHVDAMITNFHLPRSTLMCLIAGILTPGSMDGIEWLKALYRDALEMKYRFYSYGDAMLIL